MFTRERRRLWLATFWMTGASIPACAVSGFTLSSGSWSKAVLISLIILVALCLHRVKAERLFPLLMAADALLLLSTISTVAAIYSYVAMRHSGALADGMLDGADRAVGLSWISIRRAVDAYPTLMPLLERAYYACFIMPFIVVIFLVANKRQDRLYQYVSVHGISLIITVTTSFFFPARAAFEYYGYAIVPGNAIDYGRTISGLRTGLLTEIDLLHLSGIITFPSFHATMAILFTWALWPIQQVRWPVLIINSLMWAAAVPVGGHYVVDLFGGSLIAGLAVLISAPTQRRVIPGAIQSVHASAILPV